MCIFRVAVWARDVLRIRHWQHLVLQFHQHPITRAGITYRVPPHRPICPTPYRRGGLHWGNRLEGVANGMEEVVASARNRDAAEVIGTEVEVLFGEVHTRAICRSQPFEVEAGVQPLSIKTLQRHPAGVTSRLAHRKPTPSPEISKGLELHTWADRANRNPGTHFLPLTRMRSVMAVARVITVPHGFLS